MEEQKFKIGEEVYIMSENNRPIRVRIVDFDKNYKDPRMSEERPMYTVYNKRDGLLRHIFDGGIYRSKAEAYIERIRENLIEDDELSITVDEEYYTIKIKKGE